MKEYKRGTKFKVCEHDELLDKGWIFETYRYTHKDFPGDSIIREMTHRFGDILTTTHLGLSPRWYQVEENSWKWPVATFLESWTPKKDHICEEGITPIDGWIICKTCGDNLKEVK